jgi:hypothetical protein
MNRKTILALVLAAAASSIFAEGQAPASQADGSRAGAPNAAQAAKAEQVTLNGVLAFVDDKPAIKTESATVLLAMPDFFRYAYFDGFKAGVAVKARGLLVTPPERNADPSIPTLIAEEVTIGSKTYVFPRAAQNGPGPDLGASNPGPSNDKGKGLSAPSASGSSGKGIGGDMGGPGDMGWDGWSRRP